MKKLKGSEKPYKVKVPFLIFLWQIVAEFTSYNQAYNYAKRLEGKWIITDYSRDDETVAKSEDEKK